MSLTRSDRITFAGGKTFKLQPLKLAQVKRRLRGSLNELGWVKPYEHSTAHGKVRCRGSLQIMAGYFPAGKGPRAQSRTLNTNRRLT